MIVGYLELSTPAAWATAAQSEHLWKFFRQLTHSAHNDYSSKESSIQSKEIVLALMEKDGPPYSRAVGKDNKVHDFQNCRCPEEQCNACIPLHVGTRYSNGLLIWNNAIVPWILWLLSSLLLMKKKGVSICDHFEANILDSWELSFLKWTNLVVKNNVPPYMIEDSVFLDALALDEYIKEHIIAQTHQYLHGGHERTAENPIGWDCMLMGFIPAEWATDNTASMAATDRSASPCVHLYGLSFLATCDQGRRWR